MLGRVKQTEHGVLAGDELIERIPVGACVAGADSVHSPNHLRIRREKLIGADARGAVLLDDRFQQLAMAPAQQDPENPDVREASGEGTLEGAETPPGEDRRNDII